MRDVPAARRAAALAQLRRPDSSLSGFLATEVFATHSESARKLLETAAALPYFTADLATHLGHDAAVEAIAELQSRDGLLEAIPDPEGCFAVTPLVGDVVRDRWPLDPVDHTRVVRGAAAWLAARRRYRDAVTLLIEADDSEGMGHLLLEHGADMLAAGATAELADAAALVPPTVRTPATDEVVGQALMIAGDWEGALACLQRLTAGEVLTAGVAWRIGLIHHLRGRLPEALEVYERGEPTAADTAMERSLLDAMRASALWVTGKIEASRATADAALALAQEIGEANALSAAHTVLGMVCGSDGDRRAAHAHYLRALDFAREARNVLQEIRIRVNYASLLCAEGEYRRALAEVDVALEQSEVAGFATFQALAHVNRGDASRGLGHLDEAASDYRAALALCQRLGSRLAVYPLVGLADLHRLRGEVVLARQTYGEALAAADEADDAQARTPALAGLARCVALEDPGRAASLLEAALAERFAPGEVTVLLAAGWVALVGGDLAAAEKLGVEAAGTARARGEPAGTAEALELQALAGHDPRLAAHLLGEALRINVQLGAELDEVRVRHARARVDGVPNDVAAAEQRRRRLAELGVSWRRGGVADTFGALARDASPVLGLRPLSGDEAAVRVDVLGGFRVTVEGAVVADRAWQSRKARDLLKVLIAWRGQAVPRDVLAEALWPGEDRSVVGNRLSAAMSVLRGILDPLRRHAPDHYVEATRETLRLDLQRLDVDVETFLTCADAALECHPGAPGDLDLLEAAAARYSGECLVEDLYEDWAAPLREEARNRYLAVLRRLATRSDDPDLTVRASLRLLNHDPYDEEISLHLVRRLASAGRHGEAHRHYRAYTSRMAELDIEPMPFPAPPRTE